MKPIRIQRKRTKGWKMPENTVSVTRPGKFGNPFKVGTWGKVGSVNGGFAYVLCWEKQYAKADYTFIDSQDTAVKMFQLYRERYPLSEKEIHELRGKNLACFCKEGEPCHADVLLKLANA